MPVDHFGERIAACYDDVSGSGVFDPAVIEATVDVLANLAAGAAGAAGAPVLELGIGTGRIALPLSERGVRVHGIDLSTAMLARLREKPGAARVGVTVGDFANTRVPGTFGLAYLVFNTIMNLTSQDEQVACFRNVADHLEPGGRFVVEVGVPELQRLPAGEAFRPFTVSDMKVGLDEYDVATQRLVSHHYSFVDGRADRFSIPFRYVWPAELDLMARLAGMRLLHRWSGWDRQAFTSDSTKHVSVWEKP
jgi:SAM-dependent methyltransferase